jgi:hypothetical protein
MIKQNLWTLLFFLTAFTVLSLTAFFNYAMDPFWCFNFSHGYNSVQLCLNEREQKINAISFRPFNYTGLLIGDSRVTYMNQSSFKNHKIFNLSVSNLGLNEVIPLIQCAEKKRKNSFEKIYMGVNFFSYFTPETKYISNNSLSLKKTLSTRLYVLFNMDMLKFSYRTFKSQFDRKVFTGNGERIYTYDNIAQPLERIPSEVKKITEESIKKHKRETYIPNKKFEEYLVSIKKAFPNSKITVFTTPVSEPLFNFIIEAHADDYKNWLRTLVNTYDEVYHFMYLHPLTQDYTTNFVDSHHYLPNLGDIMIKKMEEEKNSFNFDDFGILLNKENLEKYLKSF